MTEDNFLEVMNMAAKDVPERSDIEGIERILARHRAIGRSLVVPLIAYVKHLESRLGLGSLAMMEVMERARTARMEGRREALEAIRWRWNMTSVHASFGHHLESLDPATLSPKEPT